jgi:hypothetical protein
MTRPITAGWVSLGRPQPSRLGLAWLAAANQHRDCFLETPSSTPGRSSADRITVSHPTPRAAGRSIIAEFQRSTNTTAPSWPLAVNPGARHVVVLLPRDRLGESDPGLSADGYLLQVSG